MGNKQALGSSSTVSDVAADANVDLKGKYAIVTGANTGIGLVTARALVQMGAHVIVACRDQAKIDTTVATIKSAPGSESGSVSGITLELSSIKSIKSFAKTYRERNIPLHMLVLNAGVMPTELLFSEDGFEMQFAVNHLGHFLLANLLLDIMKNSGSARIVSVSSNLHSWGSIYWDDLNAKKNYSYGFRYNQSKLANVLFTRELQRRLQEEGSDVAAYAIHPGVIRTDLQRHAPGFIRFLFSTVGKLFMKSLEQGAATTLYATVHPQAQGLYFADCAPAKPGKNTKNAEDAKRLWEVSEEMVDLKGALAEVLHAAGSNMKERKKEKKTKKSTKKQEDASQ